MAMMKPATSPRTVTHSKPATVFGGVSNTLPSPKLPNVPKVSLGSQCKTCPGANRFK